eukprot:TRINITY_DN7668_c0_g2_i1.p1 TRINITY_DN7668_c0_g2~~TRINITY_DN7668_c0_g2_i1.p1  ORF type:complete len:465 (+),score=51.27 TRINITY_DN7668_c0_g2_i1:41-1435(+)
MPASLASFVFYHPYARIFTCACVFALDWVLYAVDPTAHSKKETFIPVVGEAASFVFRKYPPHGWSLVKIEMWLFCIVFGCMLGRVIHHGILRDFLKLEMFGAYQPPKLRTKGSWTVMLLTVTLALPAGAYAYNAITRITYPRWYKDYTLTNRLGMSEESFAYITTMFTFVADFWAVFAILDQLLQDDMLSHTGPATAHEICPAEADGADTQGAPQWVYSGRFRKRYHGWSGPICRWWDRWRITAFWASFLACSTIVAVLIPGSVVAWEHSKGSTETVRALIASLVAMLDVAILAQDWEFPSFNSALDIKLPGLPQFEMDVHSAHWGRIYVSGKWMSYGPLFVTIVLDLNAVNTLIGYHPKDYAQYTNPRTNRIYFVDTWTEANRVGLNLTWAARNGNMTHNFTDPGLNSRFIGTPYVWKLLVCIPPLCAYLALLVFMWHRSRYLQTLVENVPISEPEEACSSPT